MGMLFVVFVCLEWQDMHDCISQGPIDNDLGSGVYVLTSGTHVLNSGTHVLTSGSEK